VIFFYSEKLNKSGKKEAGEMKEKRSRRNERKKKQVK